MMLKLIEHGGGQRMLLYDMSNRSSSSSGGERLAHRESGAMRQRQM
jgi:hypothetical protein